MGRLYSVAERNVVYYYRELLAQITLLYTNLAGKVIITGNLTPYADNADALLGGLVAGDYYVTDGTGAAPLNVAGIVMQVV